MKRKLVYGVGINDADYKVTNIVEGKKTSCPYYVKWTSMLERGYSSTFKKRYQSYFDVSVCKEWHTFSTFKQWMMKQDWQGLELDKDMIYPNNKRYSPKTCVFVSHTLNSLLNTHENDRGLFPLGVTYDKRSKNFQARLSIEGKQRYLGYFKTVEEAEQTYLEAKINHLKSVRASITGKRIRKGLKRHIKLYKKEVRARMAR